MAGTPATVALTTAHIAFSIHEYVHDPRSGSYGLEAAAALGLPADQVFKTLIANVDAAPTVAIVPVNCTLDLKLLAAALGGRKAELTDPAVAQRLTGYVVGGISPIGQRKLLPTVLDESALLWDMVYVSGGRRGMDIGLVPADLVDITHAITTAISRAS
ncbi:MAG: Cys-tRNA(Pro) deacylase [Actinomycetes bacterium]